MIVLFVRSMRPGQWVKNLFVLAPMLFGRKLMDVAAVADGVLAVVCFCLLASALYVFNDIADAASDRSHTEKRHRPIASGRLPVRAALPGALLVLGASFGMAASLGGEFVLIAALYAVLAISYSLALKRVVILDVMVIAAGFVLRVMGGAAAVEVEPSHWLISCAFLLALFLGFAKRRQELLRFPETAVLHRRVLGDYSVGMVEQINLVLLGVTIVSYMLYTVAPDTVARFGTDRLLYGTVFVLYGLLRYLVLIQNPDAGASPGELLLKDKPLALSVAGWIIYNVAVIYYSNITEVWRGLVAN